MLWYGAHRRVEPVRSAADEVSWPKIVPSACPKIKWFCPNIYFSTCFFLPKNCYFKNCWGLQPFSPRLVRLILRGVSLYLCICFTLSMIFVVGALGFCGSRVPPPPRIYATVNTPCQCIKWKGRGGWGKLSHFLDFELWEFFFINVVELQDLCSLYSMNT